MNSSQMALVASALSIVLAALVLAAAQRRVLARPEPRTVAYVVAWLVAVTLLGGFRSATDYIVGNQSAGRMLFDFAWIAAATAFSLFVAHRVIRAPKLLPLFILHAVVMALVSYI